MVSVMTESHDAPVTHPSGWWKASDGRWYSPDQTPGASDEQSHHASTRDEAARDLATAMSMAVGAIVIGGVLPSSAAVGSVTLLLGGTAGAFLTRWWLFGRSYATET